MSRFSLKMSSVLKAGFSLVLLFISLIASGQTKVQLDWQQPTVEYIGENNNVTRLYFAGAFFETPTTPIPFLVINQTVSGRVEDASVVIDQVLTSSLSSKELALVKNQNISADLQFRLTKKITGSKTLLQFLGAPLLIENGEIRKVTELSYHIDYTAAKLTSAKNGASKTAVATVSAMKTGDWYKIGVLKSGVYKLDYNFLKLFTNNVDNIDPRKIRIFGNGTGMLPESALDDVPLTLEENRIMVVGEGDGSFDENDYVLFYAVGPHVWEFDSIQNFYNQRYHLYSDTAFYFVNYGETNGLRIQTAGSYSGTTTDIITTYQSYQHHEIDTFQLNQSGRLWLGERFAGSISSYSVNFKFKNINSSYPLYVKGRFAASSIVSSENKVKIKLNGSDFASTGNINPIGTHYTSTKAYFGTVFDSVNTSANQINLEVTYNKPHSEARAYIDYITVNATCNLQYTNGQLLFRNHRYVGPGKVGEFRIASASDALIWDVTNPLSVFSQGHNFTGSEINFKALMSEDRAFVAFSADSAYFPYFKGEVANQNLLGYRGKDYIIVCPEAFKAEAKDLAEFHSDFSGLDVGVATCEEIYNEFSSGAQDVSAIRNFMKYLYDNSANKVRYLMLLGDASYDYKDRVPGNTNLVPTFQSEESFSPLSSFSSDDFFAMLDDASIYDGAATVDISVGRFPGKSSAEVQGFISKLRAYLLNSEQAAGENCCTTSPINSTFGKWKNDMLFVADDGNQDDGFSNIHFYDTENISSSVEKLDSSFNIQKVYMDAFKKISSPGGGSFPEVERIISDRMLQGSRYVSYIGHGGEAGWADEKILDVNDIRAWTNKDKLAIFLTATCEFSRYDNPSRVSAGEWVIINPNGGAIAMLTTVRLVYGGFSNNIGFSINFFKHAIDTTPGVMNTMGEAVMKTKIESPLGSHFNNRKFALLGDPAMPLNNPYYDVTTTGFEDDFGNPIDTLKALEKVVVKGEIKNPDGSPASNYTGILYPTIFDGEKLTVTLDNNNKNKVDTFTVQNNILFKGKASVTNGKFEFKFIVPKDISYNYGEGKIGYYVANMTADGKGYSKGFKVGGTSTNFAPDANSPEISMYLNDSNFVDGGLTNESPILIVNLSDESGINTAGNGLGHDIVLVIDGDNANGIVLNDYYEANLDDYTGGKISYPLQGLREGPHRLSVKVWDIFNNSSESSINFIVSNSTGLALEHVLNYPNPFTTSTNFYFEHNHPCTSITVQVKIFTIAGKLIKTITVEQSGSANAKGSAISWDGKDDFGDAIGRGVYLYQLEVLTSDGLKANKLEKLVILK